MPWHSISTAIPTILQLAYIKHSKRIPFVGPIQPEPSPIIKKIREMEERRKVSPTPPQLVPEW